jgi:hyperosmotically inducible protein
MRIPVNSLKCFGATALLALAIGATGCHSNPDRTTGQAINDKMTAMNVNHALSSDAVLKYPDVHVQVYNGQAQLTGFVDTEQQRKRAAELTATVPGVTQVINEITLKPEPTGRAQIRDVTGDVNHPNRDYNQTQPPPR